MNKRNEEVNDIAYEQKNKNQDFFEICRNFMTFSKLLYIYRIFTTYFFLYFIFLRNYIH